MNLLDAALSYAARGWPVFPVHTPDEGACSCTKGAACERAGKHPRTPNGLKDATTDAETIRAWWSTWPEANIGLRTGNGLVVIDCDPGRADTEAFERTLPETLTVLTGGGGRHYFLAGSAPCSQNRLAEGVDVRGEGGYVVAAPSLHASGSRYQWDVGSPEELAELPEELAQLAARKPANAPRLGASVGGPGAAPAPSVTVEATDPQARKRARAWLAKRPGAVSGESGHTHTLTTAAHVLAFGLDEATAFAELWAWNERCEPSWSEAELRRKVAEAAKSEILGELRAKRAAPAPAPAPAPAHGTDTEWDWERELVARVSDRGVVTYEPLLANAALILEHHPEWTGGLAFDEFAFSVAVRRPLPFRRVEGEPWSDRDDEAVAIWLQRSKYRLKVSTDIVARAVQSVAHLNRFDSLRDDLTRMAQGWDGRARIGTWVQTYLGARDSAYARRAGEVWLLAAAARGLKPGCKADLVLIAEGDQGLKKSTAFRVLAGADRFTDEIADFGTKDAAVQLQGVHVVEIAELDTMGRADVARVKAFLSKNDDRYVPKYARHAVRVLRRCVFSGTVNGNAWNRDETGGRRFLPIECDQPADIEALTRDREQLLGEAAHRVLAGEPWWLEGEEALEARAEADARYQGDAWEDRVGVWLAGRPSCSVAEVLAYLYRDDDGSEHVTRWSRGDQMRVAAILQRLGWERRRDGTENEAGRRPWRYHPRQRRQAQQVPTAAAMSGQTEAQKSEPLSQSPNCPNPSQQMVGDEMSGEYGAYRRVGDLSGRSGRVGTLGQDPTHEPSGEPSQDIDPADLWDPAELEERAAIQAEAQAEGGE